MKFEVVEDGSEGAESWIVRRDGAEVSRHRDQEQALAEIARRLGDTRVEDPELSYSLTMRYRVRA
jgi:hypothetical protein